MTGSLFSNRGTFTAFGTRSDRLLSEMSDQEFNDFSAADRKNQDRFRALAGLPPAQVINPTPVTNNNPVTPNLEDATRQARDLAQFRLGLDLQQMARAAELREQESANNFGRTQRLTDQTFNWQRLLNQDTEGARTQRNTDTLSNQRQLQQSDIDQQNFSTRRSIGLAMRRLGG